MRPKVDISDCLAWEEGIPRPRWEELKARVESAGEPDGLAAAWTDATRQWLTVLRDALAPKYRVLESEHFQLLTWLPEGAAVALLDFAEKCRRVLLAELADLAAFEVPGKLPVIAFKRPARYYTYLAAYYPEGRYGGSGGVHVRKGRCHIAMRGPRLPTLETTLAHELTHASLAHRTLPQWVEEGLTQKFEGMLAARRPLEVTGKTARQHKRYWGKHGLAPF